MGTPKAVLLFSGGLDSILCAHIMKREGVDFLAFYAHSVFSHHSSHEAAESLSRRLDPLGVPLEIVDITQEQISLVKNPPHGFGANCNPCIDCKILIFKKAKEYMDESGASFLVSGEVVGERPMSQHRDVLALIEKEAGAQSLILRPLSAQLLKPTVPEENGWITRDNLYGISGRGRKPQLALASRFGIQDYPQPAGGCLLTNPSFCRRLKDLLRFTPDFGAGDARLLTLGRHFRLSPRAKLIVARDKKECLRLEKEPVPGGVLFAPRNTTGPVGLGAGRFTQQYMRDASCILASYCKEPDGSGTVEISCNKDGAVFEVGPSERERERFKKLLI